MAAHSSRDELHKFAGGNLLNKIKKNLCKENWLHIYNISKITKQRNKKLWPLLRKKIETVFLLQMLDLS